MRAKPMKLILFSLAALSLLSIAAGQSQEKIVQPLEKHEVEVRLILVDVLVTKGGDFFPGLKMDDFELYEDEAKVPINSCDLISLGQAGVAPAQEKAAAGTPVIAQKKRLAVLYDGITAWDREFKKGAQQISDELVSLVKGGMDIMILSMDSQKGLRIVQPFTDQEAIVRAAAAKAQGGIFSPFLEYLSYNDSLFVGNYMNADAQKAAIPAGGFEPQPVLEMRNMEHTNIATDKLTRTIGGLLASLHMLESLPGRKNLLFISAGIPDFDAFQRDNVAQSIRGSSSSPLGAMQSPVGGRISIFDPFGILGKETFQTGEDVIREIIRVANDRNISIYSLDPGTFSRNVFDGASAEYFDRETADSRKTMLNERYREVENLKTMSEKTGAALLRGSNKLDSFRDVIKNDLSYYYQLSYYPPKRKPSDAYHKIEVKLKDRGDLQVRARDGYSDYQIDQTQRLKLARAFYTPELFLGKLPFRAEFVPFLAASGKFQPWISLALPAKQFFVDRFAGKGKKSYELHFWIKGAEETDRVLAGQISIPFDIDDSFKERLASLDYLRLFFAGPGVDLKDKDYRIVVALFDPETGDIGTWISNLAALPAKGAKEASIINGVVGNASPAEIDKKSAFSLNAKDASLESGQIRFFPKITGRFPKTEDVGVLVQIYYPRGAPVEASFAITGKDASPQKVEGTKLAESWDKSSKVWSGVFKLNFESTTPGDYVLKIEVPTHSDPPALVKEIRLTLS